MKTKICTKCGVEKDINMFGNNKKCEDGHRTECKKCKALVKHVWYEANKEALLIYSKNYNKINKEAIKISVTKNKKNRAETFRKYEQSHKEMRAEKHKIYINSNKENIAKSHDIWCKNNKGKCVSYTQNRRAQRKLVPSTLTNEQWESVKHYFKGTCAYCGKELPLAQEHFIPLSIGGEYTHNNIICACKNCNSSKNNKDFFEWYPKYKYYSEKREKFLLEFLGYNNSQLN